MSTGESICILKSVLILDVEADVSFYNTHKVTDLCVTDIFGSVILRTDELSEIGVEELSQVTNGKLVIAFDSQQDYNFIHRECDRSKIPTPQIHWFCGKKFLEGVLNLKNLSLKKVCSIHKLKYPKHNAKDDCRALARVLRKVIKTMPEKYTNEYVNLVLAILEASKETGIDMLPVADTLTMDQLIKEIEDRTTLGESYLELFRNSTLDVLTARGSFATNVDILKRGDADNNVT